MSATLAGATLSSRLLGAVMAFELSKDMITCGMWILRPESMMGRIASLSSAPTSFAYVWMLLALLVVPYLVLQVTGVGRMLERTVARLACWAILASGVFWAYLGYLAKNLDYGHVPLIFLLHSATCVAMAAILALGLNATRPDGVCDGVSA